MVGPEFRAFIPFSRLNFTLLSGRLLVEFRWCFQGFGVPFFIRKKFVLDILESHKRRFNSRRPKSNSKTMHIVDSLALRFRANYLLRVVEPQSSAAYARAR